MKYIIILYIFRYLGRNGLYKNTSVTPVYRDILEIFQNMLLWKLKYKEALKSRLTAAWVTWYRTLSSPVLATKTFSRMLSVPAQAVWSNK